MVTVLSNLVGDVGLLITIGMIISYGSWNIYIYNQISFVFRDYKN